MNEHIVANHRFHASLPLIEHRGFSRVLIALLLAVSWLTASPMLHAQELQPAAATCGTIKGETGEAGVTVMLLTSPDGATGPTTISSGSNGAYQFSCVPFGRRYVKASKTGRLFIPNIRATLTSPTDTTATTHVRYAFSDFRLASSWGVPGGSGDTEEYKYWLQYVLRQACSSRWYEAEFCAAADTEFLALDDIDSAMDKLLAMPKSFGEHELTQLDRALEVRRQRASAGRDVTPISTPTKNHDLNSCSAFDDLPAVGPWFRSGGMMGTVDNLWFKRACNNHDQCYQHGFDSRWTVPTTSPEGPGSRAACDSAFLLDMRKTCDSLLAQMDSLGYGAVYAAYRHSVCNGMAYIFYQAVNLKGSRFYHATPFISESGVDLSCVPPLSGNTTWAGTMGTTYRISAPHAALPWNRDAPCLVNTTGLSVTSVGPDRISLTWVPARAGWPAVMIPIEQKVYARGPVGVGSQSNVISASATSTTISGLKPGTRYEIEIVASFQVPRPGGGTWRMNYGDAGRTHATTTAATLAPCSEPIVHSVAYGDRTLSGRDLGSTSGRVQVFLYPGNYHTGGVRMTIRSQNAARTTLYDQYIAAHHSSSGHYFEFNPAALGNRFVDVVVNVDSDHPDGYNHVDMLCPGAARNH